MSFDIHLRGFNFKSVCTWTNRPVTPTLTLTPSAEPSPVLASYIRHSAKKPMNFVTFIFHLFIFLCAFSLD